MDKKLIAFSAMALLSAASAQSWAKSPDAVRPDGGRPAAPIVTPRALLQSVDSKTLGWYSYTNDGSETIYSEWKYNADETFFTSWSSWFRRCISSSCTIYTDCSSGYLVAPDTSSFCGTASSGLFCSHHVSYTSSGASVAYSWYWCDLPPLTGITFYGQNPDAATTPSASSTSNNAAMGTSTTTAASSSATPSSSVSAPAATASSQSPPNNNGSNNTGIIAGSVIGGVAAIVIIALLLFCCCRRRRRRNTTQKNSKSSATATTTEFRRTSTKAWPVPQVAETQQQEPRSQSFNAQPEYQPLEKQDNEPGSQPPYVSPMLNSEDEYVQRANARWSAVSPIIPSTHPGQQMDEYRGPEQLDQHTGHGQQQYYDTNAPQYGQSSGQYTQRPWV